jgi:hypothetical protein
MRNMTRLGAACAAVCLGIVAAPADGAVLARYEFGTTGSETTTETSPVFNPTIVLPGLTASPITDPNNTIGLESSSAATTPANAPFLRIDPQSGPLSPNDAQTANKYFQFSLTVPGGSDVDLTSLTFDVARGGGATPRGFFIRSSLDNFASTVAVTGSPAFTANTTNPIGNDITTARPTYTAATADLSAFQNIQDLAGDTVTFRVYTYAPAAGNSIDFDNITINGDASNVPEPASLATLGLGGLALIRRRRRA